jgi:galactitol-specific phosphotransferase system IIC component
MKITTLMGITEMMLDVMPVIEKHGFDVTNIADKGGTFGECIAISVVPRKKEKEGEANHLP